MTRKDVTLSLRLLLLFLMAFAFPAGCVAEVFDYQGPNNGRVGNKHEGMLRQSTSYRMYVPHPNKGHQRCSEELLRTFLRAYIELRMGDDFGPGQKLNKIDLTEGWVGNPKTYQVASFAEYSGNKQAAIWLPNENAALAWQQYLKSR